MSQQRHTFYLQYDDSETASRALSFYGLFVIYPQVVVADVESLYSGKFLLKYLFRLSCLTENH